VLEEIVTNIDEYDLLDCGMTGLLSYA